MQAYNSSSRHFISHLTRVLCFIFINQIHQKEPGARRKGKRQKFIYSGKLEPSCRRLASWCPGRLLSLRNGTEGHKPWFTVMHVNLKTSLFGEESIFTISKPWAVITCKIVFWLLVYKENSNQNNKLVGQILVIILNRSFYHLIKSAELRWGVSRISVMKKVESISSQCFYYRQLREACVLPLALTVIELEGLSLWYMSTPGDWTVCSCYVIWKNPACALQEKECEAGGDEDTVEILSCGWQGRGSWPPDVALRVFVSLSLLLYQN